MPIITQAAKIRPPIIEPVEIQEIEENCPITRCLGIAKGDAVNLWDYAVNQLTVETDPQKIAILSEIKETLERSCPIKALQNQRG